MNPIQQEELSRVLLLGESEDRYGAFELKTLSAGRVACCLSVGSDPSSPALATKGHAGVPNEDGLLVLESEHRVLLAVADAHYGTFASHVLLRRLSETLTEVPPSPAALLQALREVEGDEPGAVSDSESTLLVTVLRRDMGAGFGFSYGDSSCTAVGGRHEGRPFNRMSDAYVQPTKPWCLSPDRASFFEFDVRPGELLLVFTDGITECHYGHPETSLGPLQLTALFGEVGAKPEAYAKGLTEWALKGVEGHPGGQDNLALIVAAT